jgi:hypothetical protein
MNLVNNKMSIRLASFSLNRMNIKMFLIISRVHPSVVVLEFYKCVSTVNNG